MIVNLDSLWLNDALNLADCYVAEFSAGGALSPTLASQGSVRQYANNRSRAVVPATSTGAPATASGYDATVYAVAADVAWLQSKVGKLLLIRDPFGVKFYGMFFVVKPVWHRGGEKAADVSLTLTEVSYDEVVG